MQINTRRAAGFSLIELALIVGIVGLMAATALESYRTYSIQRSILTNQAVKTGISDAMARYFYENKRYPCPADPSLPPSDPKAGIENCMTSISGNVCDGKVCRVPGATRPYPPPITTVLTGTIPYITMGVTMKSTLDSWGSKLGYAVTESLTQAGNYNDQNGVINIQYYDPATDTISPSPNPNVLNPAPYNVTGTPKSFELAIVSYGQDLRGAYNYMGHLRRPCTGTGIDLDNCNGDNSFVAVSNYMSYVTGNKHYDDPILITNIQKESDKWQVSSTEMNNKGNGRVGIGTDSPTEPLDVNGNILTQTYYSDSYCNDDGSNCFNTGIIAGTGMVCNNGFLTGFKNNSPVCLQKFDPASVQTGSCGAYQFISGFDSTGHIICSNWTSAP